MKQYSPDGKRLLTSIFGKNTAFLPRQRRGKNIPSPWQKFRVYVLVWGSRGDQRRGGWKFYTPPDMSGEQVENREGTVTERAITCRFFARFCLFR